MSWSVEGSFNARDKVSRALTNLEWLKENSDLLTGSEIYRMEAIRGAATWRVKAFEWLEQKRQKYDADYAEIKSLEIRMNQTAKALRDFEAEKAQRNLKADEDLLEANRKLAEENYWLKTELSGLKQTGDIVARARKLK